MKKLVGLFVATVLLAGMVLVAVPSHSNLAVDLGPGPDVFKNPVVAFDLGPGPDGTTPTKA